MRYGVTYFNNTDAVCSEQARAMAEVLKNDAYESPNSLLETVRATLLLNGIGGVSAYLRNGNVDLSCATGLVVRFSPIN